MITSQRYVSYAGQIASLFCKGNINPSLCHTATRQRIVNYNNNTSFESLLSNLNNSKFYAVRFLNPRPDVPGKQKYDAHWYDTITGQTGTGEAKGIPNDKMGNPQWIMENILGWQYIEPLTVGTTRYHIGRKTVSGGYGIAFVPGQVPGGSSGGGSGSGSGSGGGSIVVTSPPNVTTSQIETQQAGFDLSSLFDLLKNPVVLIGVVVGGYLIFRNSK